MAENTVLTAEHDLGFVYSPLSVSSGVEVAGNVPPSQQYDVASNTYFPDYTQTYLQLKPSLSVSDPDGDLTEEEKTVSNLQWYVAEDGEETAVSAGSDHGLTEDGILVIKRNIEPDHPVTYRWEGDLLDPRTGGVYRLGGTLLVGCGSVSEYPVLTVDSPQLVSYYPPRESSPKRTITAHMKIGSTEIESPQATFYWQKRDHSDMVWADLLPDSDPDHDVMDYDVRLSDDRRSVEVDMEKMGEGIDLRVYGRYNPFAKTDTGPDDSGYSTDWVDEKTPVKEITLKLHYPDMGGKVLCTRLLPGRQKKVYPTGVVTDPKGVIEDPEKWFDIEWKASTGNAQGTVSAGTTVASGATPAIDVALARRYGGHLRMEIRPRRPLAAALDPDGNVLTDDAGNVLLI